jgi:uncharacterized protein (DUF4213/DUF364 family)
MNQTKGEIAMAILEELLTSLDQDNPVRSVLVGAHWTAVCSRTCGLASTLIEHHVHGQGMVRHAGHLHQKSARDLAEYALSDNQLEASIGMAAINSLLNIGKENAVEINAFNVLAEEGRGRNVALVGHFPFIPKLRPLVGQLWVIEQSPGEAEYPPEAAADLIPKAAVVAVTGSSLINHTIEGLLKLCHPGATVVVLGPSTPLSPVLFRHGATILSGSCVLDEDAALRTVGQAANFQQVEGVKLVSLRKEK